MEEPRKTSNGCKVARRVPRRDARCHQPSDCIAAIDFGTTNCSVAYILPGESEKGPELLLFDTEKRIPTAVLFNKEGIVEEFGKAAREACISLNGEKLMERPYFEYIKMNLQHDKSVNRMMTVKAANGKQYYLVEVIAHILKYLKDKLIEMLNTADVHVEATDFDWVITVPAIWRARGKQMMREAGYKAGLCSCESCPPLQVADGRSPELVEEMQPDKLSLALEPECAAIFSQNMTKLQVAKYCEATTPFSATKYLVVDIGGGTVDISAHQLMKRPQPHINVIHTPTGNDFGGNRINKEFQKFLETLVGDPGFRKFLSTANEKKNAENRIRISKIIYESFERQKIRFGDRYTNPSKSFEVVVPLDGRFINTYRRELEEGIARRRDDQIKLDLSELRISSQLMEKFYKPVTDGIIQCIRTTLRDVRQIEKIYLVGGFGGSKYIWKVIQESFGNSFKYVVPAEPAFAVIRGAVIYKNTPDVIKSRKVDATYGISTNSNFIDGLHDKKYLWVDDDGVRQCKCLFSTVIEHGEVVGSEEVCKSTFIPVVHNQTSMQFTFLISEKRDVFYVSEATEVGEIVISMPDPTGDKEREVEAMFDFSHTEIQVKVFDQTSGNEVKTVLDFLT